MVLVYRNVVPFCVSALLPLVKKRRQKGSVEAFSATDCQDENRAKCSEMPVFVMSGVSCFLPYSGIQPLHLYEPRYVRMHSDLIKASAPNQRLRSKPKIVAAYKNENDEISRTGVVLELMDWKQVSSDLAPRISAKFEAGPRVQISQILNRNECSGEASYLVAEVEIIDDSPSLVNYADVQAAWQNVWELIRHLVELQEKANERPCLTSAALALSQKRGVLSAIDVWRPVGFVQELHFRQASAVHSKYGPKIAKEHEVGALPNDLHQAYKAELGKLRNTLQIFPALLRLTSMVDVLEEASQIVHAEIRRVELSLSASKIE